MLDFETIDQMFEAVGRDTAKELFALFLSETGERIGRIKELSKQGNSEDLTREAHSLKSTALTYGLPELGERARILEMSCIEGTFDTELVDQVRLAAEAALKELAVHLKGV